MMSSKLFDAVYEGDEDTVFKLIFEDVDVNGSNEVGNRAIHAAAFNGNVKIIDILLRAGADAGAVGRLGNTPLHYAAKQGHLEAVKVLLGAGVDPTVRNGRGNSPRDLCALMKRQDSGEGSGFDDGSFQEARSNKNRAEIVKLLDQSILTKCAFLKQDSSSSIKSTEEEVRKTPLPNGDGNKQSKTNSILESVKPLIEAERRRPQQQVDLIQSGSERELIPGAGSPMKQKRAPLLLPSQTRASAREIIEKIKPPSPPPIPKEDIETEHDEDNDQILKPPKKQQNGFYVEIDGKQVWVDAEQEQHDDDDDDYDDDEEEEEDESDNEQGYEDEQEQESDNFVETELSVTLTPGPVGLGMQLEEYGRFVRVSALHPHGPANEQGVVVGNVLTHVNSFSTEGMLVDQVKALLAKESQLNHELELVFVRQTVAS